MSLIELSEKALKLPADPIRGGGSDGEGFRGETFLRIIGRAQWYEKISVSSPMDHPFHLLNDRHSKTFEVRPPSPHWTLISFLQRSLRVRIDFCFQCGLLYNELGVKNAYRSKEEGPDSHCQR